MTRRMSAKGAVLTGLVMVCACEDDGPTEPVFTSGWSVVEAGEAHACGLWADGEAYCWGSNQFGERGDGTADTASVSTPVPVATNERFVSLTVGDTHACALTAEGAAYCWGQNALGQLGTGTRDDASTPSAVLVSGAFAQIDAGVYHTCGVDGTGAAFCWGGGGSTGLGRDLALGYIPPEICSGLSGYFSERCSTVARAVDGGHRFTAISAGLFHTCGLTEAGEALCWGWNSGALGNGEDQTTSGAADGYVDPAPVGGTVALTSISAGSSHSCGVDGSGVAYCWGASSVVLNFGQLGNGSFDGATLPVAVSGGTVFAAIEAAEANNIFAANTCGRTSTGVLSCWGANRAGQLGASSAETCSMSGADESCSSTPQTVGGGLSAATHTTGLEFTCMTTTDREAYCWGVNDSGQLGNGSRDPASAPTRVVDPES